MASSTSTADRPRGPSDEDRADDGPNRGTPSTFVYLLLAMAAFGARHRSPAVTALGAVLFLGEGITRKRVVALGLAVVGVLNVNVFGGFESGSGREALLGSVLVFGAVVCEAAYSIMGKRLTADVEPDVITSVAAGGALIAFLPLAFLGSRACAGAGP